MPRQCHANATKPTLLPWAVLDLARVKPLLKGFGLNESHVKISSGKSHKGKVSNVHVKGSKFEVKKVMQPPERLRRGAAKTNPVNVYGGLYESQEQAVVAIAVHDQRTSPGEQQRNMMSAKVNQIVAQGDEGDLLTIAQTLQEKIKHSEHLDTFLEWQKEKQEQKQKKQTVSPPTDPPGAPAGQLDVVEATVVVQATVVNSQDASCQANM